MIENQKLLKKGLLIIVITLIVSIGIGLYLQLDSPVFLKSYFHRYLPSKDGGAYLDVDLVIQYITNADDNSVVNYIEFEEYPELYVDASEHRRFGYQFFNNTNSVPGRIVGRYSVREVYLTINANNVDTGDEDIRLTKAKVYFSDGDVEEVDIGELVLYSYGENNRRDHFEHRSSSSSSDGTSSTQVRLKEDIELIKMESNNPTGFQDLVEIKIGGKDYRAIEGDQYKAGDYLTFESLFRIPKDREFRMYDYDLHPKLYYKDSEGNTHIYRFLNVDYRKYRFEFCEIIRFLWARGEL